MSRQVELGSVTGRRIVDTTAFDIMEAIKTVHNTGAINFVRTLLYSMETNQDYRICFANAMADLMRNFNPDRVEILLRDFVFNGPASRREDLDVAIDLAFELRKKLGINLFKTNPCLLETMQDPWVIEKQKLLMDSEIFLLAHLANSPFYSTKEAVSLWQELGALIKSRTEKSVEDLKVLECGLRKYVSGLLNFWRRRDIESFEYPLTLAWKQLEIAPLFEKIPDTSFLQGPSEISQAFVKLLNKFHSLYPSLLRFPTGNRRMLRLNVALKFGDIGSAIVRATLLYHRGLSEPKIYRLIETGNLFIEFIEIVPGADNISSAIMAAFPCVTRFHGELTEEYSGENYRKIAHIENVMRDIINAVKERRPVPQTQCGTVPESA
jgi:hypothetical protein